MSFCQQNPRIFRLLTTQKGPCTPARLNHTFLEWACPISLTSHLPNHNFGLDLSQRQSTQKRSSSIVEALCQLATTTSKSLFLKYSSAKALSGSKILVLSLSEISSPTLISAWRTLCSTKEEPIRGRNWNHSS